jgi:UDP-N-acetylglucosamine 2-epimerase (non-hydrolysing)
MSFALITGTRPEIIKMFPVMRAFDSEGIDYKFIHTGQHHDYELFLTFIDDLNIKIPDYNISLASASGPIEQLSEMILKIGSLLKQIKPSSVIVQGDTNSVVASGLAAIKSRIPLVHLEAGLRSYDWRTPEEYNRRLVDHMSNVLFTPTIQSKRNLRKEQVPGSIFTVGNTVIDAVKLGMQMMITRRSYLYGIKESILSKIKPMFDLTECVLLTLHREENVDDRDTLRQILSALADSGLHYICPMHPRTVKKIHEFGLEDLISATIKIIEPVGYFDLLTLLKTCRFVISDSGGIQEEVTSPLINKHALILRNSTERPESVASGHTIMCPIDYNEIKTSIRKIDLGELPIKQNFSPYGDGDSAHKIVKILMSSLIPIQCKMV